MRILFISAFYPPYVIGGWEQLVQDINHRLQERKHVTCVLASNYGVPEGAEAEPGVERSLSLEAGLFNYSPLDFFLRRQQQLESNLAAVRAAIRAFQPDVVFIHVMWNLSKGVAWQAEQLMPGRVVYYIANDWPYAPDAHTAYWEDPARSPAARLFKGLLAPFALKAVAQENAAFELQFEHVMCVSQAIRRDLGRHAGIPDERMEVIYNGVETERFTPREPGARPAAGGLKLLYAGSLARHKGVHTAVEAMALLAKRPGLEGVSLTLVGSGHPDYEAGLREIVARNGLDGRVMFRPRVDREAMPELLAEFDVLVFPSVWEEPLARMTQEAMAAGLVVVGTPTGGTPEILHDGETGLVFAPEDAAGLADQLERLSRDEGLRQRLTANARRLVLEKFDLTRMIAEIEGYLFKLVEPVETSGSGETSGSIETPRSVEAENPGFDAGLRPELNPRREP